MAMDLDVLCWRLRLLEAPKDRLVSYITRVSLLLPIYTQQFPVKHKAKRPGLHTAGLDGHMDDGPQQHAAGAP